MPIDQKHRSNFFRKFDLVAFSQPVKRAAYILGCVLIGIAVTSCASRPGPEALVPIRRTVPGAKLVTFYVASTRGDSFVARDRYQPARSPRLTYSKFVISIPPNHKAPNIEWQGAAADPQVSFATFSETALPETEFKEEIAKSRKTSLGKRYVGVFVHGYNNTFQESLFRMAQLVADSQFDGTPILFAWPSVGEFTGYVADKEAATASRDALVHLLLTLTDMRSVNEITLIGHSMGAWLTAEALRQLRLTGQDQAIQRLHTVMLAAPDIDPVVFRSQLAVIGRLDPPMTVLVAKDDRALSFSAYIANTQMRVGNVNVNDPIIQEISKGFGIQVIDITSSSGTNDFNHDRFIGSTGLMHQIVESENHRGQGQIVRAGAFVLNSVLDTADPARSTSPSPSN